MANINQIIGTQVGVKEAIGDVIGLVDEKSRLGDAMVADLLDWYEPGEFALPEGGIGKIAVEGRLKGHGYGEPAATATLKVPHKKPVIITVDLKRNILQFEKGKKTWMYEKGGTPAPGFVLKTLTRLGLQGVEE